MSDTDRCEGHACDRPARAAVRVTRPTRGEMRITLFPDDRIASKTAVRYCHQCVTGLMGKLIEMTVARDV